MTILPATTRASSFIFCKGRPGFSAELSRGRVCVAFSPEPPRLQFFVVMGHRSPPPARTSRRRAGRREFRPGRATPSNLVGLRLPGPRRWEGGRRVSNANLAIVCHPCRLGTNRRESGGCVAHPNGAVVLDRGDRNFHGADFFHDFLQHLGSK